MKKKTVKIDGAAHYRLRGESKVVARARHAKIKAAQIALHGKDPMPDYIAGKVRAYLREKGLHP